MAAHVLALTGAGISADSGVRTFRDAGGLWEGLRPEDVATPEAWARHPDVVWRFYQQRRAQLATVTPNDGHRALAAFGARCAAASVPFTLVTQNVDDLHERAGSAPLHMHGEIAVLRCEQCGERVRNLVDLDSERFVRCGDCGAAALRPDVVWFGEVPHDLDRIQAELARCTHFLAIGTSGAVWPAAGMLEVARRRGAKTIVQALEPPDNLDAGDDFRPGRAAVVLPALFAELARALHI